MPVQNSFGSVPVQAVNPPPEGTMATQLSFLLTAEEPSIGQSLQLSSQSGLMLSQVVTICIDNSDNIYAVSITHGVFNENTLVPAFSSIIIPTFSSKSNYPINVAAVLPPGAVALTSNLQVNIIFMNYARTPGSFGATSVNSIIGTGQNATPLLSDIITVTSMGSSIQLLPIGNYILDSLDIFCDGIEPTTGNQCAIEWSIISLQSAFALAVIARSVEIFQASAGGFFTAGGVITSPINLSWSQGLLLPRGCSIVFEVVSLANITTAQYRLNASGFATP